MRNLLMTVMLLLATVLLYTTIVTSPDGIRDQMVTQGENAIEAIEDLTP